MLTYAENRRHRSIGIQPTLVPGRRDTRLPRTTAHVAMLVLTVLAGCEYGTNVAPRVVQVEGQVLLDDEPVSDARVVFVPEQSGTDRNSFAISYGVTDMDGQFKLEFADGSGGALTGGHRVLISKLRPEQNETAKEPNPESLGDTLNDGRTAAEVLDLMDPGFVHRSDFKNELIPFYYNAESELRVELRGGDGVQRLNFELSSVDPLLR